MSINEQKQNRTESTALAAGWYWVGDPCYAFRGQEHEVWMEWLRDSWEDTDPNGTRILDGRVRGALIAASGTAYGDGSYSDQEGRLYGVDAGLIGAVHANHWFLDQKFIEALAIAQSERERTGTHTEVEVNDMHLVYFPEPFSVSYDDGVIRVGELSIPTGWEDEDEEGEDLP